jgi:hypothetical protein
MEAPENCQCSDLPERSVVRKLYAAADRPRSAFCGGELGGNPVSRDYRVPVGGGDQGVRSTHGVQPVTGVLHSHTPGVAGSFFRAVQRVKSEGRVGCGDLSGAHLGAVGAVV